MQLPRGVLVHDEKIAGDRRDCAAEWLRRAIGRAFRAIGREVIGGRRLIGCGVVVGRRLFHVEGICERQLTTPLGANSSSLTAKRCRQRDRSSIVTQIRVGGSLSGSDPHKSHLNRRFALASIDVKGKHTVPKFST